MTEELIGTQVEEDVDRLFDRIERALGDNPDDHARSRIAKLQRIVDESSANMGPDASDAHVELTRQAMEIMTSNVRTPLTIAQISHECNVSPTLLKQTFKAIVGVPVYQWYRSHRLERACALLSETELPIAQISAAVGYSNSSKFAKAFREETGLSPREWRATHA